jgi:hypothetical protein
MRQEHKPSLFTTILLERIKREYAELLQGNSYSLQQLFSPKHFRFEEFCKGYTPHLQAEALKYEAERFGQKYDAWLANSKHFISCAWYLYPSAEFERVLTITKNLSIGFYLNDVMGRDVFQHLSPEQQVESRKLIENMALLDESLEVHPAAHPLELANAGILREFKENSPKEWFDKFLRLYCHHLNITHKDRNVDALGYIPDLYEYMDNRCHYAAVHHLVLWIEYSSGEFLEWESLLRTNFSQKMQRLHWIVAAFPALANDLFSFESEVIDNDCDSNLVMILLLNDPELSLKDAIFHAAEIVRNLVLEIVSLTRAISLEVQSLTTYDPELAKKLNANISGILQFVHASWLWQIHTKRYKRPRSIWMETTLVREGAANAV